MYKFSFCSFVMGVMGVIGVIGTDRFYVPLKSLELMLICGYSPLLALNIKVCDLFVLNLGFLLNPQTFFAHYYFPIATYIDGFCKKALLDVRCMKF